MRMNKPEGFKRFHIAILLELPVNERDDRSGGTWSSLGHFLRRKRGRRLSLAASAEGGALWSGGASNDALCNDADNAARTREWLLAEPLGTPYSTCCPSSLRIE